MMAVLGMRSFGDNPSPYLYKSRDRLKFNFPKKSMDNPLCLDLVNDRIESPIAYKKQPPSSVKEPCLPYDCKCFKESVIYQKIYASKSLDNSLFLKAANENLDEIILSKKFMRLKKDFIDADQRGLIKSEKNI